MGGIGKKKVFEDLSWRSMLPCVMFSLWLSAHGTLSHTQLADFFKCCGMVRGVWTGRLLGSGR